MLENRRIRLAAAGVYANTLPFGAAWDDTRFVFQSGATQGIGAFGDLLTSPYLRDVPAGRSPYRPVTAISYALDWTLGGGRASFFHWTNVLLHVGVTGLLMAVMGALMVPTAGVIVGGAWFAVHPVHVEAVANLAGRAELLAAFFGLLTILLYLRGSGERRPDSRTPTPLLLGGALLSFAFALGAKENAVVVVPLLVLVELLRGRGNPWRERLRRWPFWVGLTALAAGYMLLRRSILGTFTTHDVAPFILNLPPGTRVATAVANWLEYARLMVFPVDLVVDYGPAVIMPSAPVSLGVLWGLMVLASCIGLCAILWRRTRLPALGALWFAAAVLHRRRVGPRPPGGPHVDAKRQLAGYGDRGRDAPHRAPGGLPLAVAHGVGPTGGRRHRGRHAGPRASHRTESGCHGTTSGACVVASTAGEGL